MAVDLLDAPLRVSWDICSVQHQLATEQLKRIAEQILDAGIFFVSLESCPLKHSGIRDLLGLLTSGGCKVALNLEVAADELALLAAIPESVRLYIDCSLSIADQSLDTKKLIAQIAQVRERGHEPYLLWVPRAGELPVLPDLLAVCATEAICGFKLPNQKISVNSGLEQSKLLPTCSDLEQLTAAITSSGISTISKLQLEVHDLFLWELLQPLSGGSRSEYGGCQAGNSLGHIDVTGQLWPCSSWPQPLGSLLEKELLDLWQTEEKLMVRKLIASTPKGCEGCRDYQVCFGGCRGLSSFCRNDDLKRDLLCAAKR